MVVARSALPNSATAFYAQNPANGWYQRRFPDRYNNVALYASHATRPGDGFYEHARQVGAALGEGRLGVVTGGGDGSMRAAAQGALSRGGHTIGMAMDFIGESGSPDVHREFYKFDNFNDRLKGFDDRSALTAAVPGGIGTLMEITKKLTELSTDKTAQPAQKQIVLFDKNNIYRNFKRFLEDNMVANGMMTQAQVDMLKVVDENHVQDGVAMLRGGVSYTRGLQA